MVSELYAKRQLHLIIKVANRGSFIIILVGLVEPGRAEAGRTPIQGCEPKQLVDKYGAQVRGINTAQRVAVATHMVLYPCRPIGQLIQQTINEDSLARMLKTAKLRAIQDMGPIASLPSQDVPLASLYAKLTDNAWDDMLDNLPASPGSSPQDQLGKPTSDGDAAPVSALGKLLKRTAAQVASIHVYIYKTYLIRYCSHDQHNDHVADDIPRLHKYAYAHRIGVPSVRNNLHDGSIQRPACSWLDPHACQASMPQKT